MRGVMKKTTIVSTIITLAVVPLLFVANVSAAKKPSNPPVDGVGGVRYFLGSGSCELPTSNVTVAVSSGYPKALYTVSANGASITFSTDRYGKGTATLAVPAPTGGVEYADVTTSVNGVSQTDNVQLMCTVDYAPTPTPLPIINPNA